MAAGMAMGEAWFKVPEAIRFVLTGRPSRWVSGKDIILHIIGKIGVDGALYKSMEFTGEGVKFLNIDDRFTIANMAIEAGAKNGIFEVDEITLEYIKEHSKKEYKIYSADADAKYEKTYEIDLTDIKPTVSFPHLPDNTRTIDNVGNIKIDQVVIGSCTNGRITDLRIAAEILKGRKVHPDVRCIIFPATQKIWKQAMNEGLFDIFVDAGVAVSTPTCGPCLGGHMGILANGEKPFDLQQKFCRRMGHTKVKFTWQVRHSSSLGRCSRIASPDEIMEEV